MKKITVLFFFIILLGFVGLIYVFFPKKANQPQIVTSKETQKVKTYKTNFISLDIPEEWQAAEFDVQEDFVDAHGLSPSFYISKPDLSGEPRTPDAPTQNLVMLDFRTLETQKDLEEVSKEIIEKMISNQYMPNYIFEDSNIKNSPAKFISRDVGNESPIKSAFPSYIIFKQNQNQATLVSLEFFSINSTTDYYSKTVNEINKVVQTIEVTTE